MTELRYGHSEGHTDVCYSDNFKYIVTCGSEGDVRIWDGVDDADQRDNCVGEKAWAVFQREKNLYVGTDTNIVQSYTFPDFETDGIITRFTAPATQIVVSPDGKKLVASSCDMNIHIVDLHTLECKKISDHLAPVLSVSIDPKCEFMASSSCDGSVRVWAVATGNSVQRWDVIPKSNSFENSPVLCRLDFDPDGRNLAVPVGDAIKIYKRETWALMLTIMAPNSENINIVKYSPCGKYIAGGTCEGMLYIWKLETTSIVKKCEAEKKAICGVAWCKSKSVAFVNTNGQLGSLDISEEVEESHLNKEAVDPGNIPLGVPEFDDDDDDDENVISLEKIKSGYIVENGEVFAKQRPTSPVAEEVDDHSSVVSTALYRAKIPLSELQQPFQPTSTPVHLQQRFMAWNIEVGVVRQFNFEDLNDIDVEFHDTSHHPSIRMNNILGHTMACLTPELLILAAPKNEDNSSKMVVIMLKSRDGQKEWDISFGDEDVLLVAGGSGWVAAITDLPVLHIFSADGNQTDLLSIPGNPVSMVGHKDRLCVFFHSGVGLHGDQHLSYAEFKINPRNKQANCFSVKSLPLSAKSSLRWAGYTYEGSLATFDTLGVVRVLYRSSWRPICFLDKECKSEFDHYFLLGINEYNQVIKCVLCKGAYYPPVMPKPLVTEVRWKMPLCEMDSDKSKLEEEFLRSVISLPNISFDGYLDEEDKKAMEKNISVVVMKLFALACRSELDSRAISLCEAMPSVDIVKLAAKYAAKLGRHNLAEKVNEVATRMSSTSHEEELAEIIYQREESPEPEPIRSTANENQSQDMFEDSQSAKENLILNMKKKKARLSPKPLRIFRTGNPFKKQKEDEATTSNGGDGNTDNSRVKFMDWYESNRSRLQEDFPLLKEGELIMASMKVYRQEMNAKSNLLSSLDESFKVPKTTTLDDSFNISNKSLLDDSKEENTENILNGETKKRKLPSDESQPAKKVSTSSKLKNFSFTKRKD